MLMLIVSHFVAPLPPPPPPLLSLNILAQVEIKLIIYSFLQLLTPTIKFNVNISILGQHLTQSTACPRKI